jgi:hypothetical protein
MKFKNFKILISIIALIQFTYSSLLETRSKTNSLNSNQNQNQNQNQFSSTTQIKSNLSNSIKSTNTNTSNLKSKMLSKNKSTTKTTTLSLSKLLKRSSFYQINGINPMISYIPAPPVEEIPKKINQPKVDDPSSVKGEVTKILEDWLMISSDAFSDKGKFPDVYVADNKKPLKINLDSMKFRVNDAHKKIKDQKGNLPHDKNCFWFRLSGLNLYYSSTKTDYNILGAVKIADVVGVITLEGEHTGYECFIVKDNFDTEWKICSASKEKRNLWVCTIEETLGIKKDLFCDGKKEDIITYHDVINFTLIKLDLFIFILIYFDFKS